MGEDGIDILRSRFFWGPKSKEPSSGRTKALRGTGFASGYFTTLTRMMRLVALWWMSRSPLRVPLMWRTMPA